MSFSYEKDKRVRSLLQKSTRRGNTHVVERAFSHLFKYDDIAWLESRTAIIVFEECWPLSQQLNSHGNISGTLATLTAATQSVKQKDAAGLGALAHAYSKGDKSTLLFAPNPRSIKIVSEAIYRPRDYFSWAIKNAKTEHGLQIIRAAKFWYTYATWEWDKACILSSCLLAVNEEIPNIFKAKNQIEECEFPYWTALDKHTKEGMLALKKVSISENISLQNLIWSSFYFESATVNECLNSHWFTAERNWRLHSIGSDYDAAKSLWITHRNKVEKILEKESNSLKDLIKKENTISKFPEQNSLI